MTAHNDFDDSTSPTDLAEHLVQALQQQETRMRDFVIAHPIPVVLGAVATGYVLSRLLRDDG